MRLFKLVAMVVVAVVGLVGLSPSSAEAAPARVAKRSAKKAALAAPPLAAGGATYSLSSPAEMKVGFGYRFAGSGGARRSTTLDLNLGVDVGSITSAEVHAAGRSYSGKVNGAMHVVLALSAIMHFSL